MTLGEQLKELRFNILRDRSDIIAGDTDSLWTDETLLEYIKDAERRFARRSLVLRDSTTVAVTQVILRNGVKTYPLHPSILSVITARYNTKESDLLRSGHSLVTPSPPGEYMTYNRPLDFALPPGEPVAYYTDETLVYAQQDRVTLSVFPLPGPEQDSVPVNMRVVRLPMGGYGRDCLNRHSQIPEDYQLDVLEWAAFRAQRTWDGDAGAPTTAADHKAAFEEAITKAQKETKSKMFSNMNYRYGRNGFTYTR